MTTMENYREERLIENMVYNMEHDAHLLPDIFDEYITKQTEIGTPKNSKVFGVSYRKDTDKWKATINSKNIGSFNNEIEAMTARLKVEHIFTNVLNMSNIKRVKFIHRNDTIYLQSTSINNTVVDISTGIVYPTKKSNNKPEWILMVCFNNPRFGNNNHFNLLKIVDILYKVNSLEKKSADIIEVLLDELSVLAGVKHEQF